MVTNRREAVLYIDTPYRPEPGSFCKPRSVVSGRYAAGQWYNCREIWHYELKDVPLFFFSHLTGKTRAVAAFMQKVEDILDVTPRSHYGPTQRKTICWVEPSSWWTRLAMRRSLFTILLRVGQHYKTEEDNFEQALFSHHYTKNTRYAVERFMAGNTYYTGRKRGWYNQFHILHPTDEQVNDLLVRRDTSK